jgi:hypothetical protein
MTMSEKLYAAIRQQRLAWSSAIVVGFTLVLLADAPVLPVVGGCVIVVAVSILRSWSNLKPKAMARGND